MGEEKEERRKSKRKRITDMENGLSARRRKEGVATNGKIRRRQRGREEKKSFLYLCHYHMKKKGDKEKNPRRSQEPNVSVDHR